MDNVRVNQTVSVEKRDLIKVTESGKPLSVFYFGDKYFADEKTIEEREPRQWDGNKNPMDENWEMERVINVETAKLKTWLKTWDDDTVIELQEFIDDLKQSRDFPDEKMPHSHALKLRVQRTPTLFSEIKFFHRGWTQPSNGMMFPDEPKCIAHVKNGSFRIAARPKTLEEIEEEAKPKSSAKTKGLQKKLDKLLKEKEGYEYRLEKKKTDYEEAVKLIAETDLEQAIKEAKIIKEARRRIAKFERALEPFKQAEYNGKAIDRTPDWTEVILAFAPAMVERTRHSIVDGQYVTEVIPVKFTEDSNFVSASEVYRKYINYKPKKEWRHDGWDKRFENFRKKASYIEEQIETAIAREYDADRGSIFDRIKWGQKSKLQEARQTVRRYESGSATSVLNQELNEAEVEIDMLQKMIQLAEEKEQKRLQKKEKKETTKQETETNIETKGQSDEVIKATEETQAETIQSAIQIVPSVPKDEFISITFIMADGDNKQEVFSVQETNKTNLIREEKTMTTTTTNTEKTTTIEMSESHGHPVLIIKDGKFVNIGFGKGKWGMILKFMPAVEAFVNGEDVVMEMAEVTEHHGHPVLRISDGRFVNIGFGRKKWAAILEQREAIETFMRDVEPGEVKEVDDGFYEEMPDLVNSRQSAVDNEQSAIVMEVLPPEPETEVTPYIVGSQNPIIIDQVLAIG